MSAPKLHAFLTKLHNEIKKDKDATAYRKSTGDEKTHIFTFDSNDIKSAIKTYVDIAVNDPTAGLEDFDKDLDKQLTVLTRAIKIKFKSFIKSSGKKKYNAELGAETSTSIIITVSQAEKGGGQKIYPLIARTYQTILDKWYSKRFLPLLTTKKIVRPSSKGTSEVSTAGKAFNLEHKKGSNIHHQIHDAMVEALYDELNDDSIEYNKLGPEVRELLDTVETILTVVKNLELGEVTVSLGNAYLNTQAGGGEEKGMMQALKKALEKLEAHNIQGSDSLSEGTRKKHVKEIIDPIKKVAKKNKKVKLTHEEFLIKNGKGSVSKSVKRKTGIGKKKTLPIKKKKLITKDTKSMFTVIAMINQKLPETVKKNMGNPRLENRSGRFAQSVKLTDATTTAEGFPSFGYTYAKNPYQVYEVGTGKSPWANPDRDPRKLIDASIRELAAHMALGRFYTRRV